jgi:hypothetical protein
MLYVTINAMPLEAGGETRAVVTDQEVSNLTGAEMQELLKEAERLCPSDDFEYAIEVRHARFIAQASN